MYIYSINRILYRCNSDFLSAITVQIFILWCGTHTLAFCSRYKDGPTGDEFPMAESLKLTIQRTLPYWNDQIVPDVSCTC